MSKKLLSEAQIRRFQSLASINPINEMGNYAMKRDEEQMEEAMYEEEVEEAMYKRDEQPHEGLYEEEEEMEMGADEDADMEEEGDDEQVEVEEEMVEKAAAALSDLQALVDALGGEAAAGGDMDDMGDMGGEDEMPMPDAGEPEEGGEEDEDALLELALEGIQYEPSQKEIVQEVAKRVARRLVEAKQAQAKLNRALGNK